MVPQDTTTSNENERVYSIAKKSTLVEAILTCNVILGFEFYGISEKKRGFVTFGIAYRIIGVLVKILFLILLFGTGIFASPSRGYGSGYGYGYRYTFDVYWMIIIVCGVHIGLDLAYNIFFKIRYQLKVRNLMKQEEEEKERYNNVPIYNIPIHNVPMTQAHPQVYPQSYPQAYPQVYPQSYPQAYPQAYAQASPQNYTQASPQNYTQGNPPTYSQVYPQDSPQTQKV